MTNMSATETTINYRPRLRAQSREERLFRARWRAWARQTGMSESEVWRLDEQHTRAHRAKGGAWN